MYTLRPVMDEVLREEMVKEDNKMGGNIPGGNFPKGSLMGGNFFLGGGGEFPRTFQNIRIHALEI